MTPPSPAARRGLGRNVVVLGLVSLLTDVSSEMLYPIIPLFLTGVLQAPMTVVGLIEGLAESTASLLKLASGRLADRMQRRLPLVFMGYGLSALSKPALALAGSWQLVLGARLTDRTGKGLRGPARDALIADSTSPDARGRAFGLHRALDTVGAVLGPLLGIAALGAGLAYESIFLLAAIPGFLAVGLLLAAREARGREPRPVSPPPLGLSFEGPLGRFLAVTALFALGNSSNAFILLRARELGFSEEGVIGLYVLYNVVYAATATPLGSLSDRLGRRRVLAGGFVTFAAVYTGLGLVSTPAWVPALLALYGLYSAATSGVARAYVADLAAAGSGATAMGAYQMVNGAMLLVASLLAGALWSAYGAPATFLFGATAASLATLALLALCREPARAGDGLSPGGESREEENGGSDGI